MKLLYMAPDPVPFPKGAAQRIEATVRALQAGGARVTLLTPATPEDRRLDGVDHRTVRLDEENFLDRALGFRAAAARLLVEVEPQLTMVRSPWEGVPAALDGRRRGVPVVYEAHGFPSVELPSHYPALRAREGVLDRLVAEENLLLRTASLFVTPSRTGRTYLASRGAAPDRIRVLPNSVQLHRFPSPDPRPVELPLILGYLGTLAPWQGLGTLLEAMARLKGRLEVRLRVAGTRKSAWARDLRAVGRAVGVRGAVDLVGPLRSEDVPAFLEGCHLCMAPLPDDPRNSLQGCCPIKILEYLAAGRAVVSTRIRPVEEILTHGETGWLVRPGSPVALAEALRHLASHPEEVTRLGRAGRALAQERFPRERFDGEMANLAADLRRLAAP